MRVASGLLLLLSLARVAVCGDDWIKAWSELEATASDRSPATVVRLRRVLDGQDSNWLKGRALVALARAQPAGMLAEARQRTSAKDPALRAAAYEALAIIGEDAVTDLVRGMKDGDPTARWQAVIGLARVRGAKAWPQIQTVLGRPEQATVTWYTQALASVQLDASRKLIIEAMLDGDSLLRTRAIRGLGRSRDAAITEELLKRLTTEKDANVRAAIDAVLRSYSAEYLAAPLAAALRARDPQAKALIDIVFARPTVEAGDALAELLQDGKTLDRDSRLRAMDALLVIDATRYRKLIGASLQDTDVAVRLRAVMALAAGTDEQEVFEILKPVLLDENDQVFGEAARMIDLHTTAPPKDGFVAYFKDILKDTSPRRVSAIIKLLRNRLRDEEVRPALALFDPYLGGANAELRTMVADILVGASMANEATQIMAAQGYLASWMFVGPFDNNKINEAHVKEFAPEAKVDLLATYTGAKGRAEFFQEAELEVQTLPDDRIQLAWQPVRVGVDGRVNINELVVGPPEYLCAYVWTEFDSPQAQRVQLEIIADDSFKCWINGEMIADAGNDNLTWEQVKNRDEWERLTKKWRNNLNRATAKDVALIQGRNRMLIKVCNLADLWHVGVRVTDDEGRRAAITQIDFVQQQKEKQKQQKDREGG